MSEGAKLITSGRPQGLGSGLCDFAQVLTALMCVLSWIMVVLCKVQLSNQSLSLSAVCRMQHCALVLEQSERLRLQAYMWKRETAA